MVNIPVELVDQIGFTNRNSTWSSQTPGAGPTQGYCYGDLDNDGDIDGYDLDVFADAYAVKDPWADFNGDGRVDSNDLALFAASFGGTDL